MTTDSTRQRIIDATLECIGKHGIQAVTNRRIAQLANVNCAAINYYFSSKEKLMNEAIEYSMDNYLGEFFRHPLTKERTGNSQLKKFLSESLSDAIASPHIIKSYLYEALMHGDYHGIFVKKLNAFLVRLQEQTNTSTSAKNREKARLVMVQMVSSVLFMGLMPDFFNEFLKRDLKEPAAQKQFVELLVNR